jgi:hypothetical protein
MNEDEQKRLEYETISDVLQTRENSTLTLLSLFISASFVIMGIIVTLYSNSYVPDFLLWMGLLLVLSSIAYKLITSDFDNRCYAHLRELEEDLGYWSEKQEGRKARGAHTWLRAERDRNVLYRWRGQIINFLLAALLAQWIVWIWNFRDGWIWIFGIISFVIINILDKDRFHHH